jgi:hypothetical protein
MKPGTEGDPSQLKESPFSAQLVTANQLIHDLKQIVDRSHEHAIRVFGASLTPHEGAEYYTEDGEAVRQAVNHWNRSSGAFESLI